MQRVDDRMIDQIGFGNEKSTFQMSVDMNAFLFRGEGWLEKKQVSVLLLEKDLNQCLKVFIENRFSHLQSSVMPQFLQQTEMIESLQQIDQIFGLQIPNLIQSAQLERTSSISPSHQCIGQTSTGFSMSLSIEQIDVSEDIAGGMQ